MTSGVPEPLRLCVIGSTGFLGSALIARAERRRAEEVAVRALVRGSASRLPVGRTQALSGALGAALPHGLFFDEPHIVVHLATKQRDVDRSGYGINAAGAAQLMESLSPHCRGIIYASSASVYGQGAQHNLDESAPERPETALAESRLETERVLLRGAEARGISALILRPRFVVGDGDRYFLPGLSRLLGSGVGVGNGRQAFSVIDADDYAEIMLGLARMLVRAPAPMRRALNVGYAAPIHLADIADILGAHVRAWIPVSAGALALARRRLGPRAAAFAAQLELIGLTHHLDVTALAQLIGNEIVGRDPRAALLSASGPVDAVP